MAIYRKGTEGVEYSVNYSSMGGVDFSSPSSVSGRKRYSYLENMYRDYDGEGAELVESIPGFRKILSLGSKIHGFYFQRIKKDDEYLIIHSGNRVFRISLNDIDSNVEAQSLRTLNDQKSTGFAFGKSVFILDGSKMGKINEDGIMSFVSDSSAAAPYIPTCYVNGVEYEQLNLLTRQFYEEFYVAYPEDIAYESPGIEYRILDADLKKCAVTGLNSLFGRELYIPTYVNIGGEKYSIEKIDDFAFSDELKISSVTISEGIKEIGASAFANCFNIETVNLPDSIITINASAFESNTKLSEIRLGRGLISIGDGAFRNCENLQSVKYALNALAFNRISQGSGIPSNAVITENSKNDTITIAIPVKTPAELLAELCIGGTHIEFTEILDSGEHITGILARAVKRNLLESSTLRIRGYARKDKFNFNSPGVNFISGMNGREPGEAIMKCTVCECFDGRVFLSGNPDYPNTVFYCARDNTGNVNPLYFGVMNYFNDGVGEFPIISLLSAGDSLAVFKSGDDGTGSIFYHTPKETGIDILPKIYPISYVHSGIFAIGNSITFFDDPVFISAAGLFSLDKKKINLDRSIVCRSHNVNPKLLSNNLSEASLAVWCGYLALLTNGKIFLADSRDRFMHETGNTEYEWYYLSGIGSYVGDDFAYEYIKSDVEEYQTREDLLGKKTNKTVRSKISDSGITYFYVNENGTKYRVGKTSERHGGTFNPATILFGIDNKLLFFGTDNGDVCIFNNDKRGIPPHRISESEGFDLEAYQETMRMNIHPEFYSFDGHAPRYALSTVTDDGGIHDMRKDTVKGSFVMKCKSFGSGEFTVEVKTDKRGYAELASFSDAGLNFEDLDFSSLAFTAEKRMTVPIAEKEKGWCEKQISVFSDNFASPIGIYSISYRLRVRGKIKKMIF